MRSPERSRPCAVGHHGGHPRAAPSRARRAPPPRARARCCGSRARIPSTPAARSAAACSACSRSSEALVRARDPADNSPPAEKASRRRTEARRKRPRPRARARRPATSGAPTALSETRLRERAAVRAERVRRQDVGPGGGIRAHGSPKTVRGASSSAAALHRGRAPARAASFELRPHRRVEQKRPGLSEPLPEPHPRASLPFRTVAKKIRPELAPALLNSDTFAPRVSTFRGICRLSQGWTLEMYSAHSARLASRKCVRMCSPSAYVTTSSFSRLSSASERLPGAGRCGADASRARSS